MKMAHGSVCLPTSSGRKDDMAVILPELSRTASLLKQCLGAISAKIPARSSARNSHFPVLGPLPFMDKPAALFLLVDGLRQSNLAAEWCAKRLHTHLLPRLSATRPETAAAIGRRQLQAAWDVLSFPWPQCSIHAPVADELIPAWPNSPWMQHENSWLPRQAVTAGQVW